MELTLELLIFKYNKNKMADSKTTKTYRTGIGSLVFLIFLTLKLGGWGQVANWSWWWVTSPLWIPLAALIITGVVMFTVKEIIELFD